MDANTHTESISVFSNQFIETFTPEKLSNIHGNIYDGGATIVKYGAVSSGVLLVLFGILMFMYFNREAVIQTINQSMLWFYLGKPNEILAVEIPENSRVNQLYDNFDILNMIQAI